MTLPLHWAGALPISQSPMAADGGGGDGLSCSLQPADSESIPQSKIGGLYSTRLWFHRDAASFAMEVETIRGIHDLKAIRDELDGWRVVAVLREASLANLATGRTPQ